MLYEDNLGGLWFPEEVETLSAYEIEELELRVSLIDDFEMRSEEV